MNRNIFRLWIALVIGTGLIACEESDPSDPNDNPPAEQMVFKNGSQYEFTTYSTDPSTNVKVDATERTRRVTLVNQTFSAYGETGVALYLDSLFTVGGVVEVIDSLLLRQQSGTNDVYRYASLAPELDFTGLAEIDLGKEWMHEARLGSSSARWLVGSARDTIPYDITVPGVTTKGLEVSIVDSVVASAVESVTIEGQSYPTTKTTHHLIIALTVLAEIGVPPLALPVSYEVKSVTLERLSWTSSALGVIVKEEREGSVIDAKIDIEGTEQGVNIPIPGYRSELTRVISN